MDCPHCHTPLPDDAKFCGVCGGAVLAASNAGCPSLGPNSCLPAAETACSPPPAHSVRQLFLILFWGLLPLAGWVILLVWSFAGVDTLKRQAARALLLWKGAVLLAGLLFFFSFLMGLF